jgi:coiled-coil domain-containing protein 6
VVLLQLEQLSVEKNKLYREKIDLENQLEAEQEYIMNKLQKQVLVNMFDEPPAQLVTVRVLQVEKLGSEKKSLQQEKSDLKRQVRAHDAPAHAR